MEAYPPHWSVRNRPLVVVSGCYDLLHSGHVAFFKEASSLGDLYVSVGNDENISQLKGRPTAFPAAERLYMVLSVRYVSYARICDEFGDVDFADDLEKIRPDIFFVNVDGDRDAKREVCARLGIRYVVSARIPDANLTPRSSTHIKASLR